MKLWPFSNPPNYPRLLKATLGTQQKAPLKSNMDTRLLKVDLWLQYDLISLMLALFVENMAIRA